jgi:predicted ArsR family transcriptional regulator
VDNEAMGEILGITKRAVLKQVNKLKAQHRLRRVGSARGGYWEVIE